MKPKYWWYGIVKKQIMMNAKAEDSLQNNIISKAMRDANKEIQKLPNADLRLKAVKAILIEQTATYEGVAMEVNYSESIVRRWINCYVNLVGKKAGY